MTIDDEELAELLALACHPDDMLHLAAAAQDMLPDLIREILWSRKQLTLHGESFDEKANLSDKPAWQNKRQYGCDGLYFRFNGHNVMLTTNDGIKETNRFELDPKGCEAFVEYIAILRKGER